MKTNFTAICNPGFRYTFDRQTVANVTAPAGLYEAHWKGERVVVNVDAFGEIRIARETPVNNESRFARDARSASFSLDVSLV